MTWPVLLWLALLTVAAIVAHVRLGDHDSQGTALKAADQRLRERVDLLEAAEKKRKEWAPSKEWSEELKRARKLGSE